MLFECLFWSRSSLVRPVWRVAGSFLIVGVDLGSVRPWDPLCSPVWVLALRMCRLFGTPLPFCLQGGHVAVPPDV